MPLPVPVNIITGTLGAGKTTAISRLLAAKPRDESWVVILNEFTDTGIDTLTLASAAQGVFDVRMIPGGCLCCTGEEDFQRQLSRLLQSPQRPARIVIEPSGIGHPGAIVTELRAHEAAGTLKLMSTIALVEVAHLEAMPEIAREQIETADVVLLAKADGISERLRAQFFSWSEALFPVKRLVGLCVDGVMAESALAPPVRSFSFTQIARPAQHALAHATQATHEHEEGRAWPSRVVMFGTQRAKAQSCQLLQRDACGWLVPPSVLFVPARLIDSIEHGVEQGMRHWAEVERMKAVLRTGIEEWSLVQYWNGQWSIQPSAWRLDSRMEVQLCAGVAADWSWWDSFWQQMIEV